MSGELAIRAARAGDRPAMERICANVWEWGDYVPEVWDRWLADREGALLVGELGGEVVALGKITVQTPEQVWLEGMRVDAGFRQQGIAGRFLEFCLDWSHGRGARTVRLGTGGNNTAVHKLMARHGMERVQVVVLWKAPPLADGPKPIWLGPRHAGQVETFMRSGPVYAQTHRLIRSGWAWQDLSAGHAGRLLGEGRVLAGLAPDGSLATLAIIDLDAEDNALCVCFCADLDSRTSTDPAWPERCAEGTQRVEELALAVRRHAAEIGAVGVEVLVPDVPWLRDGFGRAGFDYGDWKGELWVFERHLAEMGGA